MLDLCKIMYNWLLFLRRNLLQRMQRSGRKIPRKISKRKLRWCVCVLVVGLVGALPAQTIMALNKGILWVVGGS